MWDSTTACFREEVLPQKVQESERQVNNTGVRKNITCRYCDTLTKISYTKHGILQTIQKTRRMNDEWQATTMTVMTMSWVEFTGALLTVLTRVIVCVAF